MRSGDANGDGNQGRVFSSYAEWIRQVGDTHEIIEQRQSVCGASLTQTRLAQAIGDPPTPDLKVFMVLAGESPPTVADVGFGRFECHVRPGRFAVAGADIATDFVGEGPYDLLALSLPWNSLRSQLEELIDAEAGHLGPKIHRSNPDDALVGETLRRMWSTIPSRCGSDDRLRFDGLVNVLVGRLVQISGVDMRGLGKREAMKPERLASVLEYVESSLRRPLSLDDLSQVAGCSRFHFSRLFRRAVGASPMAYVTRRRLERVKEALIREPGKPLHQLASLFGYADQSHLVRQFRRQFGEPPKSWLARR